MYLKPEFKCYSANVIEDVLGVIQAQYTTITIPANISGTVSEIEAKETELFVDIGDNGDPNRGLVGFNIGLIPQGSTIVSAILRIFQTDAETPDTYIVAGGLLVDHVDFEGIIDVGDFNGGTITPNIGTISNNANIEWKTLDVTNTIQADVDDGLMESQYRIRFANDVLLPPESFGSGVGFEDYQNTIGSGNLPELVVTYQE